MIKFRSALVLCGTICAVIVLALMISAATYGSSLQLLSHGPVPPPNGDPGDNGGNIISHGPVPPPNGDPGDNGGNIISHGPVPPPNGDPGDNGGNIRLV